MQYKISGQGCRYRALKLVEKLFPHEIELPRNPHLTNLREQTEWGYGQYGNPAINLNKAPMSHEKMTAYVQTDAEWAICGTVFYFKRPELAMEFKMRWG